MKFVAMLARSDKQELVRILRNTRAKNHAEFEARTLEELDRRFPGWKNRSGPKSSGRKYNRATFLGTVQEFDTAKEGFVWLAERFASRLAEVFATDDSRLARIVQGRNRKYLATTPARLFMGSPHLAEDRNHYHRLGNGWYLNTNLSNAAKFEVLARLSHASGLEFAKSWNWEVIDATAQLISKTEVERIFADLIREFAEPGGS